MQEDFLFPFLLCLLTSKMFYVQVGLIAINDGIVLQTHISRILKTHFRKLPIYSRLLEIFNEVKDCALYPDPKATFDPSCIAWFHLSASVFWSAKRVQSAWVENGDKKFFVMWIPPELQFDIL